MDESSQDDSSAGEEPLISLVIEREADQANPKPDQIRRRRRPKRRRISRLIWLALAALAVMASASIVVGASNRNLSANQALERVESFMADAESYRFESTLTTSSSSGRDANGPGSTTVDRTDSTGNAVLPDRRKQLDDTGYLLKERVQIGPVSYSRSAETKELLVGQLWAERDDRLTAGSPPAGVVEDDVVAFLAMGMTILPPMALAEVVNYLRDASATVTDRPAGRVVLRAKADVIKPDVPYGVEADPGWKQVYYSSLPNNVDIQLEVTAAGMPLRLSMSAETARGAFESEYKFTDWNEAPSVEVPEAKFIEPTPWIEENDLEAARQLVTAMAPTTSPPGMELVGISGWVNEMEGDDAETATGAERSPCASISIDYAELDDTYGIPAFITDDNGSYLDVIVTSRACVEEADDRPFAKGPFGNIPVRDHGSYGNWELLFGDTVAQINTTLEDDELIPVLTTLAPLDIDAALPSAMAVMEKTWTRYGTAFVTGDGYSD